jgi:hypothetical protein
MKARAERVPKKMEERMAILEGVKQESWLNERWYKSREPKSKKNESQSKLGKIRIYLPF